MTKLRTSLVMSLSVLAVMTGCSNLPQGAALRADITENTDSLESDIAFYPVTKALLPAVAAWPEINPERFSGWPTARQGSLGQIIAPGDRLSVKIWDNQDNSLLLSAGARVADLGPMVVSPTGRIFVPYVGDVRVAGMGPDRARSVVQSELEAISPSAQVQLAMAPGRQNTVDLVSGVAKPGSYPMDDRNLSVLSLISQGGGVPNSLRNPRVKLQRGQQTYMTTVEQLYNDPRMDSVLNGGDKVIVEEDKRYFLSLGAAGKEEIVFFERDKITALEAISMIGGITDTRADAKGILVLREYPREAVSAGARGPRGQRVVFAIDMTSADGLFSAKNLEIQPGDVVLATENPVTRVQTVVALIGAGFGLLNAASNI